MSRNTCDSCPNKAMANLNRSLGNEDEALRIESLGCQWWWGINYTNKETGVTKLVYDCGVPHIARIVMDQGALIEEASQSIQSNRNEIALIRDNLVSTLETGLGRIVDSVIRLALPKPIPVPIVEPLESGNDLD